MGGEFLACLLVSLGGGDVDSDEADLACGLGHLVHLFLLVVAVFHLLVAHGICLLVEVAEGEESHVNVGCGDIVVVESLLVEVVGLDSADEQTLVDGLLDHLLGSLLGCEPCTLERLNLCVGQTVALGVEDYLICLLGSLDAETGCVELADQVHHLRVAGILKHVVAKQVAGAAHSGLLCGIEHDCLLHELFESHLRQDLRVEVGELRRVVATGLLQLVVEFLTLALVVGYVDFCTSHFSHCGVVAQDVAAVGQRVADDECEERHADHHDQKH